MLKRSSHSEIDVKIVHPNSNICCIRRWNNQWLAKFHWGQNDKGGFRTCFEEIQHPGNTLFFPF